MGGSHVHTDHDHVETEAGPRRILLGSLALAALATVIGLFVLWPEGEQPSAEYAAPGVTFPEAEIVTVHEPCPVLVFDPSQPAPEADTEFPPKCDQLTVEIDGRKVTVGGEPSATRSGLEAGDRVTLASIPQEQGGTRYVYVGIVRDLPVGLLVAGFVVAVVAVARWRGALALVGLVFAGLVIGAFTLPALLDGRSGIGVALVSASAIMMVVLYLAHGPSVRTSAALAGTLIGVGITALLAGFSVGWTRLSGLGDESGEFVRSYTEGLDFQGLLVCAIIIAGLGVLNDVTITQSSAVWELRAASPMLSRLQLYRSAMRIGRDHIASTIYTIVFVYAGTALLTLLLVALHDRTLLERLLDEQFAEEVVMTLTSGIGLVLAVPVTTAIATLTVGGGQRPGR